MKKKKKNSNGGSRPKPDLGRLGMVVGVSDRWTPSVSSGLTPARVAAILREADTGSITLIQNLFDEVEDKDVHLSAELFKRRMAVAGLPWEIVPASDEPADQEIAEFVKTVLDSANADPSPGRVSLGFRAALYELTEAVSHGFAAVEILWNYYDYAAPNGSGATSPRRQALWVDEFVPHPQRRFNFKIETDRAEELQMYSGGGALALAPIPDRKFLLHKYSRKGSLLKAGLLRKLLWLYLFKNYSLKDWVAFLEIYATPIRWGTYGPGAGKEEIETLVKAVINIAVDQGAVVSEACKLNFVEAQKYGSVAAFESFARFINAEMSKLIVGQTLSAQTSESGGGAMALGEVHAEVRQDIVEFDAPLLEETINLQLIAPLVEFNYGELDRYPQFKLHYEQPADTKAIAEMLEIAVRAGTRVPAKWARKQLGIPEPEEEEETLHPQITPISPIQPPAQPQGADLAAASLRLSAEPGTRNQKPGTENQRDQRERMIAAAGERLADRYEAFVKVCSAAAKQGKIPDLDFAEFKKFLAAEMLAADLAGRAEELLSAGLAESKVGSSQ